MEILRVSFCSTSEFNFRLWCSAVLISCYVGMFEYARITVQTSFQFNFIFFQLVKIILFVKMLIHISVLLFCRKLWTEGVLIGFPYSKIDCLAHRSPNVYLRRMSIRGQIAWARLDFTGNEIWSPPACATVCHPCSQNNWTNLDNQRNQVSFKLPMQRCKVKRKIVDAAGNKLDPSISSLFRHLLFPLPAISISLSLSTTTTDFSHSSPIKITMRPILLIE